MAFSFPSFTKTWHKNTYAAISTSRPELSAKGKTVLITGAGSGIGAGVAKSFANANASKLIILGRTAAGLQARQQELNASFPNLEVIVAVADIRDEKAVNSAFSSFKDTKIDIFVNSASVGSFPTIAASSVDSWWEQVEINLKGPFVVTKAFLNVAAPNAVVVNVASNASHLNDFPGVSAYAASKAGAVRFFDSLQLEYPNLRVINIQPGTIDTPMTRGNGIPGADDISLPSDFAVWLTSPEAAFLKGKYVWANWDVEEMLARKDEIANSALLTIQMVGWPFDSSQT